ncbi:MAG: hypothetical protein HY343_00665 [Lentisphaerae bacterium]|nr:hypothetical protein [Lentisphaerota bacterium]
MSMSDDISAYLMERRAWVSARELCLRFGLRPRQLRAVDDVPGLCSRCAISGNKGYKHVSLATPSEWAAHYGRERKHNIMALVNLRAKRSLRMSLSHHLSQPPLYIEKVSGQYLLPLPEQV